MRLKLFIIILLSAIHCYSQKEINQQKLLNDFDYAVQELRLQHQGFYQYVEKEKVDLEVSQLRGRIDKPMSKLEFYQLIRKLISLMNEGHGSVKLPKGTMINAGLSKSFIPLGVKFLDKELIVVQNYGEEVEGLTKGVKIISINGKPIAEITAKLLPLIASDGFNKTSKFEWIGGRNFSLLYRLVFGETKEFEMEIKEFSSKKTELINVLATRFTRFKSKNAKFQTKDFDYKKFTFDQLNDSIAYLSIPRFGKGVIDYESFYQRQFKKIDSLGIKHLIIDIQANGGGEEGNENLLFSYLSSDKIKKYRKVTMLPKLYLKNKNNKGYKMDKWQLKGSIAERGEFTLFSDYYSNLGYASPNERYIYKNKLYLLTSGYTFSGGAEFAGLIKMSNRGIFIGEETGGAYEGNVSGYTETIKLPHTNIRINIPMAHFQINVSPEIKGRGIIPDYPAPQKWEDYMNNKNAKLEFAKKLIIK